MRRRGAAPPPGTGRRKRQPRALPPLCSEGGSSGSCANLEAPDRQAQQWRERPDLGIQHIKINSRALQERKAAVTVGPASARSVPSLVELKKRPFAQEGLWPPAQHQGNVKKVARNGSRCGPKGRKSPRRCLKQSDCSRGPAKEEGEHRFSPGYPLVHSLLVLCTDKSLEQAVLQGLPGTTL